MSLSKRIHCVGLLHRIHSIVRPFFYKGIHCASLLQRVSLCPSYGGIHCVCLLQRNPSSVLPTANSFQYRSLPQKNPLRVTSTKDSIVIRCVSLVQIIPLCEPSAKDLLPLRDPPTEDSFQCVSLLQKNPLC